jgi:hypothetical protein
MKPDPSPFNGHTALLLRVAAVVVPLSLLLSSVAAVGGYLMSRDVRAQNDRIEAESLARQQASCEATDETRAQLRDIAKQSGITSGVIGGEALIAAVTQTGGTPDEATVETYRRALTRLLDPALTEIVNQLPGRRWDPDTQQCVDVELDQ